MEAEYRSIISKLEDENKVLKGHLSEQEESSLSSMPHDSPKNSNVMLSSLSRKLEQGGQNEHELRNRICDMERREKELNERLTEQRGCYNELVNQLQDHDLSLKKITGLEQENSDLLDQLEHLKEVERRFKEVHQSEEFLQGRVEELEQTESVSQ